MSASISSRTSMRTSAVRPGPFGLVAEAAAEAWSRRRLIRYLVQADLKKKGSDTLLGNVWWVVDPLLQMLVYVVLVSVIFKRGQADYPLFVFAAILPWKWFTSTVGDGITSVSTQDRLIKQVQFPKIVLPTAATIAGVVSFGFGMVPLAGMMILFYADRISPYLMLIPVIAVVQFVFSLAFAYLLAGINVFFRDVGNLSRHVLRLWFYLSPGLYPPSAMADIASAHPTLNTFITLNPFYTLFESYRAVIYGTETGGPYAPDWSALALVLVGSVVLLALATLFFKRVEPLFAKVL